MSLAAPVNFEHAATYNPPSAHPHQKRHRQMRGQQTAANTAPAAKGTRDINWFPQNPAKPDSIKNRLMYYEEALAIKHRL